MAPHKPIYFSVSDISRAFLEPSILSSMLEVPPPPSSLHCVSGSSVYPGHCHGCCFHFAWICSKNLSTLQCANNTFWKPVMHWLSRTPLWSWKWTPRFKGRNYTKDMKCLLKRTREMGMLLGNKHLEHLWLEFLVYTQGILSWFALEILLYLLREEKKKNTKPSLQGRKVSLGIK